MLGALGLADRVDHRPAQLSGGEQQRTAIARALANEPRLILADEPTGNLDPHTAEHVFDALIHLIRTTGVAALIATHNLELARAHGPRAAGGERPAGRGSRRRPLNGRPLTALRRHRRRRSVSALLQSCRMTGIQASRHVEPCVAGSPSWGDAGDAGC